MENTILNTISLHMLLWDNIPSWQVMVLKQKGQGENLLWKS